MRELSEAGLGASASISAGVKKLMNGAENGQAVVRNSL